jgi:hypothetical protein
MNSHVTAIIAAMSLSVASLSAHAAEDLFLDIEMPTDTAMTQMSGDIVIDSFSFGASNMAAFTADVSDPVTGGTFATGTVTVNGNSTETFALSDFMGQQLQFTTNQVITQGSRYIGINTIQFGATGGPMSECNVTPGLACTTTSLQLKAPEIDPASATSGLTLLLGGCAVMIGRRKRYQAC